MNVMITTAQAADSTPIEQQYAILQLERELDAMESINYWKVEVTSDGITYPALMVSTEGKPNLYNYLQHLGRVFDQTCLYTFTQEGLDIKVRLLPLGLYGGNGHVENLGLLKPIRSDLLKLSGTAGDSYIRHGETHYVIS